MARARLYLPVVTTTGDLIPNVLIEILDPGSTSRIAETIYSGPTGPSAYTQPFIVADGKLSIYLDQPRRVRVGVTPSGQAEFYVDDLDVNYQADLVVHTNATVMQITNAPAGAGSVLTSVTTTTAQWAAPAVGTEPHLGAGTFSIALGSSATATGDSDVSVGKGAATAGTSSVAVGKVASAGFNDSIAVGNNARALATSGVAMGLNAFARPNAVVIGPNAADGVIGQDTVAHPNLNNVVIGNTANVARNVTSSLAFGYAAVVDGGGAFPAITGSSAIGAGASVAHNHSTAIGAGATTTKANQVMVGTAADFAEFPNLNGSFVMKSPNGSRWLVSMSNAGAFVIGVAP